MRQPPPPAIAELAEVAGPRAAAFDADGTLWRGDVSEDFTRWMIDRGDFDAALWPAYEALNARDPAAGAIDILRFYRGHALAELQDQIARFWRTTPARRWQQPVVDALGWLHDQGFVVYVVSATPRIVLEPLTGHLPVAAENILALELEFDAAGRATGAPTGVVTHGPGKAQRLRAAGTAPLLLAAGNSVLDIELLACAEAIAWAIDPDPRLAAHARDAGWLIQFIDEDPRNG